MFFKIAVFKNFFVWHRCFPVNFTKFLKTYFLQNSSERLLLTFFYWTFPVAASDSFRFPACNFIKKEILAKMFFCEFAKFLRTYFYRTPPDDCFLSLSVNFEKFFRTLLLQSTSEKLILFRVQVAEFQPANTIVKSCFTGVFQVL